MKKEARLLLGKAVNSLVLSVEHFNRSLDTGRVEAVLILLDHSFEMLLKAAILHRGGRVRQRGAEQTIGFDHCVRKGLTEGSVRFLSKEQALTLQTINGLRDAAQHHLLDIPEQLLYMHAQAGLSLFRDLCLKVFKKDLTRDLPERVLPIAVTPPSDLASLIENEIRKVRDMLKPGTRKQLEARARLRGLSILENAIQGKISQPTLGELTKLTKLVRSGTKWDSLFPGVASVELASDGVGASLHLRLSKKEGVPIQLVKEGTPGARVVAVKRVNELDYYSLPPSKLARVVGLTQPKTTAVVRYAEIENNPDYFKEIRMGKTKFKRYSPKAIQAVREALKKMPITEIWRTHRPGRKAS